MSEASTPIRAIAAGKWWVQVRGQSYGPYSFAQLSSFAAEGRVRPTTLVTDREDGAWQQARRIIGLMANMREDIANDQPAEAANMVVSAHIVSNVWLDFASALESLGAICELRPGLWLLRTHASVSMVRGKLSQVLKSGDDVVVVDASRDRVAWHNLGLQADVRISKFWNAPLKLDAAH